MRSGTLKTPSGHGPAVVTRARNVAKAGSEGSLRAQAASPGRPSAPAEHAPERGPQSNARKVL